MSRHLYAWKTVTAPIRLETAGLLGTLEEKMRDAERQCVSVLERSLFGRGCNAPVLERPRWLPRWLWRWVPFRRTVLHDRSYTVDWSEVNRIVREVHQRTTEKSIYNPFVAARWFRRSKKSLAAQVAGWQRVAPHLGAEDSWLAWRAIVGAWRESAGEKWKALKPTRL